MSIGPYSHATCSGCNEQLVTEDIVYCQNCKREEEEEKEDYSSRVIELKGKISALEQELASTQRELEAEKVLRFIDPV